MYRKKCWPALINIIAEFILIFLLYIYINFGIEKKNYHDRHTDCVYIFNFKLNCRKKKTTTNQQQIEVNGDYIIYYYLCNAFLYYLHAL